MLGRLGHFYLVHLAEAQAQRHRLDDERRSETSPAVFARLISIIAVGLLVAWLLSTFAH